MKSRFRLSQKSLFLSVLVLLLVSPSPFETKCSKCVAARSTNNRSASVATSKYSLFSNALVPASSSSSAQTQITTESDSILYKLSTFLTQKPSKTLQSLIQALSFQNYKYKKLIQSLSKQLVDLQRQIRLHKDEIQQLRSLLQNQKEAKRKRRSRSRAKASDGDGDGDGDAEKVQDKVQQKEDENEVLTKEQIKQYQNEIQNLNVQIEKLLSVQNELEMLLATERTKLSELVQENANYKRDITTLQSRIDELQSLQKDTLDLVKVEREYYKKQIELVKEEVEKARREGLMAVEEEKLKMRKLVKALAAKEKEEEKRKGKKGWGDGSKWKWWN